MKIILFLISVLVASLITYSCTDSGNKPGKAVNTNNLVQQSDDGTIDLHIEKASCYHDNTNYSL
jgi:hypothetical protein